MYVDSLHFLTFFVDFLHYLTINNILQWWSSKFINKTFGVGSLTPLALDSTFTKKPKGPPFSTQTLSSQ